MSIVNRYFCVIKTEDLENKVQKRVRSFLEDILFLILACITAKKTQRPTYYKEGHFSEYKSVYVGFRLPAPLRSHHRP